MGTACWGTNESFDCCWVGFGYGSCFDTSRYWISIEALRAMAMVDIDGLDCTYQRNTYTEMGLRLPFQELSPRTRHKHSCIRVCHPKGEEESTRWYLEYEKWCGYYTKLKQRHNDGPFEEYKRWLDTIPEGPIIRRLYEMGDVNNDNEGRLNGKTEDEKQEEKFYEQSFDHLCYKQPIHFTGDREADKKMMVQKFYDIYIALYRSPNDDDPTDLGSVLAPTIIGPNANDPYARESGNLEEDRWYATKPYVMKVEDRGNELLIYFVEKSWRNGSCIYTIDISKSYLPENNKRLAQVIEQQAESKAYQELVQEIVPASSPNERYVFGGYHELVTNDWHFRDERHYSEYECQSIEWFALGGPPREIDYWAKQAIRYLP